MGNDRNRNTDFVTRDDYKSSEAFRVAVRKLWVKLMVFVLASGAAVGWFFGDLLKLANTPVVQSSFGQFACVSLVVYVTANLMLCVITGGSRKL